MYKVGEPVICVKSHSKGITVEGTVYTVKGLHLCSCGRLSLDVGIKNRSGAIDCFDCRKTHTTNAYYQGAERFRPLDDLYNTEIADLMEEVNQKQPFEI